MFDCNRKYDLKAAKAQCDLLSLQIGTKVLDIGSGTGALIYELWSRGMEAVGCDPAPAAQGFALERIHRSKLEDVHFPTDHFGQVMALDIPDQYHPMIDLIKESFRVTDQQGNFLAGLPLVFLQVGQEQMSLAGFTNLEEVGRTKDRVFIKGFKPEQKRTSLLLPPGVGDVYWPLVKTQALLKREGIEAPVDAYVVAPRAKKYGSEARSFPFLGMFPFLHSTGEVKYGRGQVWREAYLSQGRTVFRDVLDCDYFITWNGHLRAGKTLEAIDPDLECNWRLPRFISLGEEAYRRQAQESHSDYMVTYWGFAGTNRQILRHYSVKQIAWCISEVAERAGLRPLLIGAEWDLDCPYLGDLSRALPAGSVDLRGLTSLEEAFGLMRGARLVFGMNSGLTVMAAAFRVPTVMLIHDYLFTNGVHRDFAWNTVPPDVRGKTYFAEFADRTGPQALVDKAAALVGQQTIMRRARPVPAAPTGRFIPDLDSPLVSIRDLDGQVVFACVLRSGGAFNGRYVANLKAGLDRHLAMPFKLVCLTDVKLNIPGVETVPLVTDWPGWWAKIELFRPGLFECDRVTYFDLDTLILGDIGTLADLDQGFYGLRPWNLANRAKGQTASGIMSWKPGEADFIYNEFSPRNITNGNTDQQYITASLVRHGIQWQALQDYLPGIRSYKRECRNGLPIATRVVCFHGRPRVHECQDKWVKEAWN